MCNQKFLYKTLQGFFLAGLLAAISAPVLSESIQTDAKMAYFQQQLDEMSQSLAAKDISMNTLFQKIQEIGIIQTKLDQCVVSGNQHAKKINQLLNNAGMSSATQNDTLRYTYLKKEQDENVKKITDCSYYDYRFHKLHSLVKEKMLEYRTVDLMVKTMSIQEALAPPLYTPLTINPQIMYQQSGFDQFTLSNIAYLLAIMLVGLMLSFLIKPILLRKFDANEKPIAALVVDNIIQIMPVLLPILFASLYLHATLHSITPTPSIVLLADALIAYLIMQGLIKTWITMAAKGQLWPKANVAKNILYTFVYVAGFMGLITFSLLFSLHVEVPLLTISPALYAIVIFGMYTAILAHGKQWLTHPIQWSFIQGVNRLIFLLFLGFGIHILLQNQMLSISWVTIQHTGYILVFNLAFFWLLNIVCNALYATHQSGAIFFNAVKYLLVGFYLVTSVAAWRGYHHLALYLMPNLITTVGLIFIGFKLNQCLGIIYTKLSDPTQNASRKLRALLGIKPENKLIELIILRVTLLLPVIVMTLFALMELWGKPRYQFETILLSLDKGQFIFNAHVQVLSILRAANLFCVLALLGRMIATYIEKHGLAQSDAHTRVMVVSLIHYVSFSAAFVFSLYIAGVSTAGILLISGTLSFGIGFGLQHFASDFLSGIFIMINKQVQIGDHVVINIDRFNVEGFIKKIGTLSTQLATLTQSVVIIPNSSLYTQSITNLTFDQNKLCRLKISATIIDSQDFEKGRRLLLEAIAENPNVIYEPPKQPTVLFELNHLVLWFVIKDVNNKEAILSEINFSITQIFKENGMLVRLE